MRWMAIAGLVLAAAGAAAYFSVVRPLTSGPRRPRPAPAAPQGLDRAAFAALVKDRLRDRHKDLEAVLDRDGREYVLVVTGPSSRVRAPLKELYRSAAKSPQRRQQLVDDFLAATVERLNEASVATLEQARERLLPMVKRKQFVVEHNGGVEAEMRIPWRPLPNDVAVCFVIDHADYVRYVTKADLHRWMRNVVQIESRAIQNLQAHTEGRPMTVSKSRLGEVYFYDQGDGYDASRILVLQRQRAAADSIWPHDLVVALPDRDLLIAAAAPQAQALRPLLPRIRSDASSSQYALTDKLFLVTPTGIAPYQLPPAQPPGGASP